ncbi:larval cuticle protein A2B-like [Topomyia yanbarensis]|uniref:larval cuticle protein A2B-like n=1 Tax=Topomyia yanbarensis TaxID=2498891 RepID=UPI00273C1AD3|nr:larval cuticle protein A2B-like [Topomyia yanbarensis]XP_058840736.1 larval cuticle protein A2B-like [Topomyia yanbarensis]
MAFKFVLLTTLLAAVNAGLIPEHGYASSHQSIQHHAPLYQHGPSYHQAAPIHQLAAVHAAPVHHVAAIHAAPVHHAIVKEVEHHAPAHYEFSYSVHDGHTGDIKSQHESRQGDEVHGQYSLLDSDGHHRIVDYHADHHTGFNAVVRREPTNVKVAQPVHKVIAQPVHTLAPVAHVAHHAAPLVHSAHHIAPVAYHSHDYQQAVPSHYSQHHY